ncbi:MAG: hypothetical protein IPM82_27285 [Saprospiraceae bacterium]|nr:hypothetical protein [Saprospiraceae bacterium]
MSTPKFRSFRRRVFFDLNPLLSKVQAVTNRLPLDFHLLQFLGCFVLLQAVFCSHHLLQIAQRLLVVSLFLVGQIQAIAGINFPQVWTADFTGGAQGFLAHLDGDGVAFLLYPEFAQAVVRICKPFLVAHFMENPDDRSKSANASRSRP